MAEFIWLSLLLVVAVIAGVAALRKMYTHVPHDRVTGSGTKSHRR
jgi:hypothetical protein